MRLRIVVAAVVAVSALATGCSLFELSPQQEEEAYLIQVAQAEAPWLAAIERFDRRLSSTYSTRLAYVVAIEDAGLAEGAREALEAARSLTPPEQLANDHQRWLEFRSAVDEIAPSLTEAAVNGDVLGALSVRRTLGEAEADFLLSIGRTFCIHLEAVSPASDCPPDESLPGGDYGVATYETLREYAIRAGPLFLTSNAFDESQRTRYLAEVQPGIELLLHDTIERLADLEPPAEFAADHEALRRYFDEQYEVAVEITDANAVGDQDRVGLLYEQFAAHLEQLQASLSEAARPIVDPAF
jgi:hypothetical protein